MLVLVASVYAHPPSDIKILFDSKTRMLTVMIVHNTTNPVNHYISKVVVGLNGQDIIVQNISRQNNDASQVVKYYIPDVENGDVLSVAGYCNMSGTLGKEIVAKFGE
jgi:hypothetical protein